VGSEGFGSLGVEERMLFLLILTGRSGEVIQHMPYFSCRRAIKNTLEGFLYPVTKATAEQ